MGYRRRGKHRVKIRLHADREYVKPGECIVYTLLIENKHCEPLNMLVWDLLSNKVRFVHGSVCVNKYKFYKADIESGVNLGVVYPDCEVSIRYEVKVVHGTYAEFVLSEAIVEFNDYIGNSGFKESNKVCVKIKNRACC